MGACFGSCRSRHQPPYRNSRYPAIGKNQALKREYPKWKSDVPLTEGQLRSKRDEFWDTAPAFDGRKEIWDALKAAVAAMENSDCAMAQAIVDGASISLPHGTLMDCYDELGNHYQLPVYCLSRPINLVKELKKLNTETVKNISQINEDDPLHRVLKVRLTSEDEVKLSVLTTDSVGVAKQRLELQEGIPTHSQRWYFSGKLLLDRMKIEQCKLKKGYVIQCISQQSWNNQNTNDKKQITNQQEEEENAAVDDNNSS